MEDKELNQFYLNLAKKTYNAYGEHTGFKNFQGNPMPEFPDLPEAIRFAWIKAARFAFNAGQWEQAKKQDKAGCGSCSG